jgi:hypothetical protein
VNDFVHGFESTIPTYVLYIHFYYKYLILIKFDNDNSFTLSISFGMFVETFFVIMDFLMFNESSFRYHLRMIESSKMKRNMYIYINIQKYICIYVYHHHLWVYPLGPIPLSSTLQQRWIFVSNGCFFLLSSFYFLIEVDK